MLISIIYSCFTIFGNNNVFVWPIFKTKAYNFFHRCFSLSCDIFVYRLEKSEIESDEAIFVLFVLLIPGKTTSSFWTGQKVLTTEK